MVFENIRIAEKGIARTLTEKGEPILFSEGVLNDIVRLGNEGKIHARKTHNGVDLLDALVGYFSDFRRDGDVVYATLTTIDDLPDSKFVNTLIEKEPDLINCSVVVGLIGESNDGIFVCSGISWLECVDLVGRGAAVSSLFNQNNTFMSKLQKFFASLFKDDEKEEQKVECMAIPVVTDGGVNLVIQSAGEEVAIGDAVQDSEGNPVEDGEYVIEEGADKIKLVIKAGVIESIEKIEKEISEEIAPIPASSVPKEDFSAKFAAEKERADKLEKELNELKAKQFSQTPKMQPSSSSHSTQLSEDEKKSIRNKFK